MDSGSAKTNSVQNVRLALLFIYLFRVFTLFVPYITMRPAAPQTAQWGGGRRPARAERFEPGDCLNCHGLCAFQGGSARRSDPNCDVSRRPGRRFHRRRQVRGRPRLSGAASASRPPAAGALRSATTSRGATARRPALRPSWLESTRRCWNTTTHLGCSQSADCQLLPS